MLGFQAPGLGFALGFRAQGPGFKIQPSLV